MRDIIGALIWWKRERSGLEGTLICNACSPPREISYVGSQMTLKKPDCDCPCQAVDLGKSRRCGKCDHAVNTKFIDDPYVEATVWIDPKTKKAVRLDEAWTGEGQLE